MLFLGRGLFSKLYLLLSTWISIVADLYKVVRTRKLATAMSMDGATSEAKRKRKLHFCRFLLACILFHLIFLYLFTSLYLETRYSGGGLVSFGVVLLFSSILRVPRFFMSFFLQTFLPFPLLPFFPSLPVASSGILLTKRRTYAITRTYEAKTDSTARLRVYYYYSPLFYNSNTLRYLIIISQPFF